MNRVFQILKPTKPPNVPERFSHTTLVQIESCARRWWLLHSEFEELEGAYPEPVSPAAVLGTIVHATLERFSMEFKRALESGVATSIQEFRKGFAVREIVHAQREKLIERVKKNPRARTETLKARVSVDNCVSLFKDLVRRSYGGLPQEAERLEVTRENVHEGGQSSVCADRSSGTVVPCPGVLPEVDLEMADPPIRGKIDLVFTEFDGDTLVEYKTGEPCPEHEAQSGLYALLWRTATGRMAKERLLIYPGREPIRLGALTKEGLERVQKETSERVVAARREMESEHPSARVDGERCRSCSVRHLCNEYWNASATSGGRWSGEALATVGGDKENVEWRDMEIDLNAAERLPEGFIVRAVQGAAREDGQRQVLCKLPSEFRPGMASPYSLVRLCNVGVVGDGERLRIKWSSFSEAFWGHRQTV